MNRFGQIIKKFPEAAVFLSLALILIILAGIMDFRMSSPDALTRNLEKKIESRLSDLNGYADRELQEKECNWEHLEGLGSDMVIYRYEFDTLAVWHNEFPVLNDNIRNQGMIQTTISGALPDYSQPLARLDSSYRFTNIGSKWYLAKLVRKDIRTAVVAALEICSQGPDGQLDIMNPGLALPEGYYLSPAGEEIGETVSYNDISLFQVCRKGGSAEYTHKYLIYRWVALAFIVLACVLVHLKIRSLRSWAVSSAIISAVDIFALIWGGKSSGNILFSPSVFAEGPVFSSLGNLLLVTVLLILLILCAYISRERIAATAGKRGDRGLKAYAWCLVAAIAGVLAYCITTAISLIMNSSIELNLNLVGKGSLFAILSIAVYASLLAMVMPLTEMLAPVLRKVSDWDIPVPTSRHVTIIALFSSLLLSLVFCLLIDTFGFKKERNRAEVWANRMAIDRDLALEIQLRQVEESIASDNIIALLAGVDGSAEFIRNRITDSYLGKVSQQYDINISICSEDDRMLVNLFTEKILSGTQIAENSRFYYTYNANGHSIYAGMFLYLTAKDHIDRVLIELESIANRDNREFLSIFNDDALHYAGVEIPDYYSYAKYVDSRLVSYRGAYAYPTVLSGPFKESSEADKDNFSFGKYQHFAYNVAEDEEIFISRPLDGILQKSSLFLLVAMISFLCHMPFILNFRKVRRSPSNSFKRRISRSLLISFIISLTCLVAVSVRFVFERDMADSEAMTTDRITTIQTIIEAECKKASSTRDISNVAFKTFLDSVGKNTHSDITLFNPEGKVFMTTIPEIYDRMLVSTRIDGEAFYNITYKHQRFYKHREEYKGRTFLALYAPVFNSDGALIAILRTPFTREGNLMREAIPHSILLIVIALLLIVVSQIFIANYTDSMFGPLSQISGKMRNADLHNLEYINYTPNDEVSSLVEAYNRMVNDLSESTRQLAQNERNKAWSEMARQVAHEIKNPLTPIKLEIQRLIRLKQKNDPSWSEKFDHVAGIILEHIDMLADTANEFSTFAKLYAEEPVELDLDKVLQDQIALFDNRENIEITYMGLPDALIMGPKPQLIRVFVNLVTNAVQAIEIMQNECAEKGGEIPEGKILVCLRKSSINDNSYDVVVEDNGPGVKEEDMGKIFQPNFTTKSAGTGLGLAICNSIVEMCEGSISYRRSYSLGGASFTVNLPARNQMT